MVGRGLGAREEGLQARIRWAAQVEVFVQDHWHVSKYVLLPYRRINRAASKIGDTVVINTQSVLLNYQPRRIEQFRKPVQRFTHLFFMEPLVPHAVGRQRHETPVMPDELIQIHQGSVRSVGGRQAAVIGKGRLDQNAGLFCGLEILRIFDMRMGADVIKSIRTGQIKVLFVWFTRRRGGNCQRVDVVVPEAAQEASLAVKIEIRAAALEFADAKALHPTVDGLVGLQKAYLRAV